MSDEQECFVSEVVAAVKFWAEVDAKTFPSGADPTAWRVRGVAHSILAVMDGCTGTDYSLVPRGDRAGNIAGELHDWFSELMEDSE